MLSRLNGDKCHDGILYRYDLDQKIELDSNLLWILWSCYWTVGMHIMTETQTTYIQDMIDEFYAEKERIKDLYDDPHQSFADKNYNMGRLHQLEDLELYITNLELLLIEDHKGQ